MKIKILLLFFVIQTLTVFAADEISASVTKKSIGAQAKFEVFINLDGSVRDVAISHVGWVTRDPRVAIAQLTSTAWVQEPTLLKLRSPPT